MWRGEVRRNHVGSDETNGVRKGYMYLILPLKDKGSSVRGGCVVGDFRNLGDNMRVIRIALNWMKPVGVERGIRT
jgi:hypothetical protein